MRIMRLRCFMTQRRWLRLDLSQTDMTWFLGTILGSWYTSPRLAFGEWRESMLQPLGLCVSDETSIIKLWMVLDLE